MTSLWLLLLALFALLALWILARAAWLGGVLQVLRAFMDGWHMK